MKKESKPELVERHDAAEDGRKANVSSTAPYGIEEHMNEEQAKHETVERQCRPEPASDQHRR